MTRQNFENLYVLSPLQQGLLFHSLYSPSSGLYVDQFLLDLHGDLKPDLLQRAWQQVVERHATLRTSFHWENLDKPLQVVLPRADLPFLMLDWRHLSAIAQEEQLNTYLAEDRARGFQLSEAPLMRLALIRLSEDYARLVWTVHHIILDGWSASIVQHEVLAFYAAFVKGESLSLDVGPPFSTYISWLKQQDRGAAETFWRAALKGFSSAAHLATGRPAGALTDSATDDMDVEVHLSQELTSELVAFARRNQLTLNTLLQAAWALLLHRYTGERDVIFGVTVSGRPETLPGVELMVGNLLNTLPFRVRVSSKDVQSWLRELQDRQLRLHEHEWSPLTEVRKWSELAGDEPLFESILVFENAPSSDLIGVLDDSLEICGLRHLFKTNYPVTIQVIPGQTLSIRMRCDRRRFGAETVRTMLGHLENLLAGMVADPKHPVSTLPMLTEAESSQLIDEWNDTRTDYPQNSSIHELFERQAERSPESVAVVLDDSYLTYGELNRRANQLSHRLQTLGVRTETPVGIYMGRSLELLVGILGILKAGGACICLDPDAPEQRLGFLARDADLEVILTQERLRGRITQPSVTVLSLDAEEQILKLEKQDKPDFPTDPNSLAFIIYTSGSTGVPKGVEVCHRGVVRLLLGVDYVRLNATDSFLQLSPISFDASIFEIWGALLHGGRCVLLPQQKSSIEDIKQTIRRHGVNVLWLTASLFNSIVDEQPDALQGVQQILVGGEALSVDHVRRALESHETAQLINGYGPTEGTTFTCCYRIPKHLDETLNSVPIGRPISNTQVYVLDKELNPVPVGITGELHIGGVGLARGYLKRPSLTAESFIPSPFAKKPSKRLYKTGDLVRYLPNGNLEFLGRNDDQIKIRGFRVEPGEIESVLRQHPTVTDAVVLSARENRISAARLIAYVVGNSGNGASATALRGFVKDRLPEYMVPSHFIFLTALPLTPNGKLDRVALPAPDLTEPLRSTLFIAPRNPVEELLAGLWSAVLGIKNIGIHDDFFELGGHSLLATQLVSRVREAFKIELPLRVLFESPTILSLAETIESLSPSDRQSVAPRLLPVPRDVTLAPSFAQQRLWILDQFEPGLPAYNLAIAITIRGKLDVLALNESLNEILRRHEILRTSIHLVEGQPVQIVAPTHSIDIPVTSLDELTETERLNEVQRLGANELQQRFDLSISPLLRARLLYLSEREHVLLLSMHHIVSDGWSIGVFFHELAALYEAFSKGQASPLPPLPIQYADYAVWQREWLKGQVLESQLAYWRKQLADAPAGLDLPADHPRPPIQTFRGRRHSVTLPPKLSDDLRALSQDERVTLFMTLLAGFEVLLHRYTGESDLLIGSPIANRNHVETENLVGFFVNTLVLRIRLSADSTFRELLSQVRETALEAYRHQDVPFEKLVEELQPVRNPSHAPLFQVVFALQNMPLPVLELAELDLNAVEVESTTAKFDLVLFVVEKDNNLICTFEYNRDLFEPATIARMRSHFQTILEGVVADPSQRISELPLLTENERKQLAIEWNDNSAYYPKDAGVAHLFEHWAAIIPERVAVVYKDERLTYGELNQRANQLAHYLKKRGVGPESLIGICVERSVEMLVGILATLKAGAAYVPLDPAYPSQRLAFMLEDARAAVVLTQKRLRDHLPLHFAQVVSLDDDWRDISTESEQNVEVKVDEQHPAYVIYTSGSTGTPKGVMVRNGSLINLCYGLKEFFGDPVVMNTALITSISFDISVNQIFPTLLFGRTLHVIPNEIKYDPRALARYLCEEKIDLFDCVPSYLNSVLTELNGDTLTGPEFHRHGSTVKYILVGGEKVERGLLEEVFAHWGAKVALVNIYGLTEITDINSYSVIRTGDIDDVITIGRPLQNTRIYITDAHHNLQPVGVSGELCVAGDGVSRGYLNRPEGTAEKFVPAPWEVAKVMCRTGDLGRWLPDGRIELLGRRDQQVKIRGYRIEVGEIEAMLQRHLGVREAVVVMREDTLGDRRLVAYVASAADTTSSELLAFLKEELPEYMVPSHCVMLDELPHLPNGKINRTALPSPEDLASHSGAVHVAPRSEVERILAGIWQNVLQTQKVGIYDNFFSDLGGNSLMLIQVVSKLRECLNREVSMLEMFQFPTIDSFARHLASHESQTTLLDNIDQQSQLRRQAMHNRRQLKQRRRAMTAERGVSG